MNTINAKMISESEMEVEFGGKIKTFKTWKWSDGKDNFQVADFVFASTVVRGGKDWPVSVLVKINDGSTSIFYPSGVTLNRYAPRISCFWEDSKNQSKHKKLNYHNKH